MSVAQELDDVGSHSRCSAHHGRRHSTNAVRLAHPVQAGDPHADASSLGVGSPLFQVGFIPRPPLYSYKPKISIQVSKMPLLIKVKLIGRIDKHPSGANQI